MNSQANILQVYKELAECYERRGQAQMRDRFLVLAADAALSGGHADEAERLRLRLLQANPHHMLKPYTSFEQARAAPDVDTYVRNLRLNYPLEVASDLLRALNTSDDPGSKQMQRTAPIPSNVLPEPTLNLDPDSSSLGGTEWSATTDDSIDRTAALPPHTAPPPASRPSKKTDADEDELARTAHLPAPSSSRPRVPTKAEGDRTEPGSRPTQPRAAPAPRSAAPSSVPPTRPPAPNRPSGASRPAAPKVPPRPAPGPSPFAAFGTDTEPAPKSTPRAPLPNEEVTPESNSFLSTMLLVLVGLLGLAVVVYTFARPFLP